MIDGLLSAQEASWCSGGGAEVYTARWRNPESSSGGCALSRQSYNIVHHTFDGEGAAAALAAAMGAGNATQEITTPRAAGNNQTPPLTPKRQSIAADDSNRDARARVQVCTPSTGRPGLTKSLPGWVNLSPTSRALLLASPCIRGRECVQVLKAVGRAAMVGFHVGLVGAVRDITWGSSSLTIIVDSAPSGCITLQEALGGALYREGRVWSGAGRSREGGTRSSGVGDSAEVTGVVDRMLMLARQLAAAMAHCHRRGVSFCFGHSVCPRRS